jgi:energy-coupling factor transport system ATP-binding protein
VQPLIEARGLRHVYTLHDGGELVALDGIDLAVHRGECVGIIGANGSGKSTLARHLNGLLLPSGGQVWIDGINTARPEGRWRVRRTVGMVFQNPDNQIVANTVEEDVAFGPENLGLPRDEIRRRVDVALNCVGLADHALRPPHLLSGGQKQLVAIAGAIAAQPQCLVLDEPTSMLDPVGREQVLDAVLQLNAQMGLTVLLITHSMREAALADRVLVMHEGRIVLDAGPEKVFRHADQLHAWRLALPPLLQIASRLRAPGNPIQMPSWTVSGLVGELCAST